MADIDQDSRYMEKWYNVATHILCVCVCVCVRACVRACVHACVCVHSMYYSISTLGNFHQLEVVYNHFLHSQGRQGTSENSQRLHVILLLQ